MENNSNDCKWIYYNHAAIYADDPRNEVDTRMIDSGDIWKIPGKPILARWTTEFDCGYETNWWYVIKDNPLVIDDLKKKRRYEIKKGLKNFEVKQINPFDYKEDIYNVFIKAQQSYGKKNQILTAKEEFTKKMEKWDKYIVYGAFFLEDNTLCGYSLLEQNGQYLGLNVLKTIPDYEKYAINSAIVAQILFDYEDYIKSGGYICDGARNINHETFFQDYLEKYFEFRKAYCKLQIAYNPKYKIIIKILYPFRKLLRKLDNVRVIHNINGVMKMEEIKRSTNE